MAAAAYYFFFARESAYKISVPSWVGVLFLVGTSVFVGIWWEFFEFGFDYFVSSRVAGVDMAQQGLNDTMADLFFDMVGAFLIGLFFFVIGNTKNAR